MAFVSIPRLRILVLALGALILATTLTPQALPVQAQNIQQSGESWSLSAAIGISDWRIFEPDVAYDSDGFLHVVFPSGESQDKWSIYYTNNRSGAFAPVRLISQDRGEQRNPDIAIGSNGHIHVVYEKRNNADIYYVESTNLGATFLPPEVLTPGGARAYYPAVATDPNNAVHVVWVDRRWSGRETTTYVGKVANGSFGAAGKIGRDGAFELNPSITTTGSGSSVRVHVVFQSRPSDSEQLADYDIFHAQSVGGVFQVPRNVTNDSSDWSIEPVIASDGNNQLFLAWDTQRPYHDIAFTQSTNLGGSWASPVKLTNNSGTSVSPSITFGRSGNIPRVHIAWDEDGRAYYALFEPGPPARFGDAIELVSGERDSRDTDVAASNVSDEVAVSYSAGAFPGKAYISTKGAGTLVAGVMTLNDGNPSTNNRLINVKLSSLRGAPTEMRYSFNVPPAESAAWQPIQTDFNVQAPPDDFCNFSFYMQLRAVDGRRSATLARAIQIDSDVQATVDIRNPYFAGEDAPFLPRAAREAGEVEAQQQTPLALTQDYTRRDFFYLSIANSGECTSLSRFFIGANPNAYGITNNSFVNVLPLPGAEVEGPRPVAVTVEDALGNKKTITRTMVLDRTSPSLKTGSLSVVTPRDGMTSILADLVLENVSVEDALYPGGYWGVWITNVANPSVLDTDPSLEWQPIQLIEKDNSFVIANWSVLDGLVDSPSDRSFANRPIEVRLKFLDGAGNATAETLKFTVTLAENYRPVETFIPALTR
jgi:hypothetical protein